MQFGRKMQNTYLEKLWKYVMININEHYECLGELEWHYIEYVSLMNIVLVNDRRPKFRVHCYALPVIK